MGIAKLNPGASVVWRVGNHTKQKYFGVTVPLIRNGNASQLRGCFNVIRIPLQYVAVNILRLIGLAIAHKCGSSDELFLVQHMGTRVRTFGCRVFGCSGLGLGGQISRFVEFAMRVRPCWIEA